MGKRSRKRPDGAVKTAERPAPPRPTPAISRPGHTTQRRPGQSRIDRMIERADERPKPPWHPVPLVELCVLGGIVLLIIGAINHDSTHGRTMLVFGVALASIAGLETAAREHFTGYRSHSTLLAGLPAIVVLAVLAIAVKAAPVVLIAAGAVVFAACFLLLRRVFRSKTGVAFRV